MEADSIDVWDAVTAMVTSAGSSLRNRFRLGAWWENSGQCSSCIERRVSTSIEAGIRGLGAGYGIEDSQGPTCRVGIPSTSPKKAVEGSHDVLPLRFVLRLPCLNLSHSSKVFLHSSCIRGTTKHLHIAKTQDQAV